MLITIKNMINPNPLFRLTPRWNHVLRFRLIPRWIRLYVAILKLSGENGILSQEWLRNLNYWCKWFSDCVPVKS
jgi:hypothetical protein